MNITWGLVALLAYGGSAKNELRRVPFPNDTLDSNPLFSPVNPLLSENTERPLFLFAFDNISYTSTMKCATATESNNAVLTCNNNDMITSISFASYGTPTGACGSYVLGSCNSVNSYTVVSSACMGKHSCSITAKNSVFGGDPCQGTLKNLRFQVGCDSAPTSQPTSQPTQPSSRPTRQPSTQPSGKPSNQPTFRPSAQPSQRPTTQPSRQPSEQPSGRPSVQPSRQPSVQPSAQPTTRPSMIPSRQPSIRPTTQPTAAPSTQPSSRRTNPTGQPSRQPSNVPTRQPSTIPCAQPTVAKDIPTISMPPLVTNVPFGFSFPTKAPSITPTINPSSAAPSLTPTANPSSATPIATPSVSPTPEPGGDGGRANSLGGSSSYDISAPRSKAMVGTAIGGGVVLIGILGVIIYKLYRKKDEDANQSATLFTDNPVYKKKNKNKTQDEDEVAGDDDIENSEPRIAPGGLSYPQAGLVFLNKAKPNKNLIQSSRPKTRACCG